MKITTIKKLQEAFVGKVCTVLTVSVAKNNFSDQIFNEFFTGFIESIDEDGVISKHTMTGCKTYYVWASIVAIVEEQFISEDSPEYKKILEKVNQSPVEVKSNVIQLDQQSQFVDPELMAKLSSQAKESQSKMLRKQ
jgi:hypothetical protein